MISTRVRAWPRRAWVLGLWCVMVNWAPAEVRWVWSGAVTAESVRIKVKSTGSAPLALRLGSAETNGEGRVLAPAAVVPAGEAWVADYIVADLEPDTAYRFQVEAVEGRFRTFPAGPASFSLALGSCADTGSDHAVFHTVARHAPLFFLHTGDMHYENIAVNEEQSFHAAFDRVLASPAQSALYRQVPVVYIWDDHDYGPNNSDRTSPSREAARRAYRGAVPHYPLVVAEDGPIHHAFTVGRVRFILTDARSERAPPDMPEGPARSLLGAEQKAWLKAELLAARDTHALIVWVNTVPWIAAADPHEGIDRWSGFTTERAELAAFIEEHGITNLCMLSGDAHMLAIDDGGNNRYGPAGRPLFPVFQAAALDRRGSIKGGPYSHGTYPGPGQFGLMRITDEGGPEIRVEWSGRNHRDEELLRHEFTVKAPAAR